MEERTKVFYLNLKGCTEESYEKMLSVLSAARRARAERYLFKKDRLLSAAAGYLLDCALQEYGRRERDAEYAFNAHGKPYFKEGGLFFSLSHSYDYAACALSLGEVGVDVQKLLPVTDALIGRAVSEGERAFLRCEEEERVRRFFRLWTAKESVVKYLGEGLSSNLSALEVEFSDSIRVRKEGKELPVVLFEHPLEGYFLTVCTEGAPPLFEERRI